LDVIWLNQQPFLGLSQHIRLVQSDGLDEVPVGGDFGRCQQWRDVALGGGGEFQMEKEHWQREGCPPLTHLLQEASISRIGRVGRVQKRGKRSRFSRFRADRLIFADGRAQLLRCQFRAVDAAFVVGLESLGADLRLIQSLMDARVIDAREQVVEVPADIVGDRIGGGGFHRCCHGRGLVSGKSCFIVPLIAARLDIVKKVAMWAPRVVK
jgi:hypothetical protein